jgi:hypothetical protein
MKKASSRDWKGIHDVQALRPPHWRSARPGLVRLRRPGNSLSCWMPGCIPADVGSWPTGQPSPFASVSALLPPLSSG